MAETTFTELELCNLVQRTLEKAWTPDMSPEVWKALREYGLRLLDEAAQPGKERRAQMEREIEERLAHVRDRQNGGGPAAI